ncbi:hypothetical protein Hypma_000056 [Hypsizygus marmoreus]|uniref:F-box domain-containing protein n=1 Tax=Hypsizygus marmoreus TaxID=39966 RepID=A0A369K911_HYPMA|nr:hypothetical protein Hypma_000056 [Hypsizygus marmoreus]
MPEDVVTVLETAEKAHSMLAQLDERMLQNILDLVEADTVRLNAEIAPLETQQTNALQQITRMERVLAPLVMAILPNEVLVNIFKLCRDGPVVLESGTCRPMPLAPLAHVCRKWRSIIMETPTMWNDLLLDYKRWSDTVSVTQAAQKCLSRAGSWSPIVIRTRRPASHGARRGADDTINPIASLIIPFSQRLKTIAISFPYVWLRSFLILPPGSIPNLESADIEMMSGPVDDNPVLSEVITVFSNAPNLRQLTFRMHARDLVRHNHHLPQPTPPPVLAPGVQLPLPWTQLTHLAFFDIPVPFSLCHQMIRLCTSLLSFAATRLGEIDAPVPSETRSPTLRSLTFETGGDPGFFQQYCHPLVLPNLKHLTLSNSETIHFRRDVFSSLLSRLTCCLTALTLSFIIERDVIEPLLRSIPSLTVVEFKWSSFPPSVIEKMMHWELVPGLRRLQCGMDSRVLKLFFELLELRWRDAAHSGVEGYNGIESANIFYNPESFEKLKEVRAYVRGLGEKAMGIEIDSDKRRDEFEAMQNSHQGW